jgi:hypothetical protein
MALGQKNGQFRLWCCGFGIDFAKGCNVRLGGNFYRALVMGVKRQFLLCGTDENRQFQLCCYGWKTGNFYYGLVRKAAISIMALSDNWQFLLWKPTGNFYCGMTAADWRRSDLRGNKRRDCKQRKALI